MKDSNNTCQPNVGDLVVVNLWDCEGIERPWGWRSLIHDFEDKTLRALLTPKTRARIKPESLALVTQRIELDTQNSRQVAYWCLVSGEHLLIPSRFLYERKKD